MKCHKCKRAMTWKDDLEFNGYRLKGYKCKCGEAYYPPDEAQRVLLLCRLQKEAIRAKLGKIRSNLIIRLPKDIETALALKKGKDVLITIENKGLKIVPA